MTSTGYRVSSPLDQYQCVLLGDSSMWVNKLLTVGACSWNIQESNSWPLNRDYDAVILPTAQPW